MEIWFVLGLIFINEWIWRVAAVNITIFILLFLSSIFLFKKLKHYFLLTFILLLYFQISTTSFQSLILLDNDDQRIKSERIQFYNPSNHYMRVLFARFNLKELLEGNFNTAKNRLERNFFETIDSNVYFFAGHPRERVWANDFEKFPFIFIVPFLIGVYLAVIEKEKFLILFAIISLIVLTYFGHKNPLGPFILFPFFVYLINKGVLKTVNYFQKINEK